MRISYLYLFTYLLFCLTFIHIYLFISIYLKYFFYFNFFKNISFLFFRFFYIGIFEFEKKCETAFEYIFIKHFLHDISLDLQYYTFIARL